MDIQTKEIEVSFDSVSILKQVDVMAKKGQFVGLLGPNGSGKSTLLKAIYRTLKPTGGAVLLDGKPLNKWSVKESAKKMSVVAQHNYYNFDFAVQDIVLMGRSPHKKMLERDSAKDHQIVADCLETVGMSDFAERSFQTLSGGEQQRVILARALAQDTECLVLDEPTNHLDIKHQLELMDIVKGLNKTVISAIHDLNIAAMYCDYIYVLKDGKVFDSGNTKEVLTKSLIREVYDVDAEIFVDASGLLRIFFARNQVINSI